MSNIVHKVKEAVTGHHDKPSHSTNAGPHDSNVANKADPRVDSDRDNRGAYSAAGAGTGTGTGGYNTNTTTSGPHSSTLANKADPRVDSDRGQYGTTGGVTSGGAYDSNPRSTNAGPHSSNLANKADPRVDSDRDNRGAYSAAGTGNTTAGTGIRSGTGAGTGTGAYGSTNTTTSGPHSSNLANKADPRVDSDRGQYGTTGGVTAGGAYDTNPRSTNAGPHSSNLANKVDPRVDSDLDNRARHQNLGSNTAPAGSSYATPGSGAAQQTAGPHDKNILNKLDPRVDSDLDNSRTIGNATRY